MRRALSAYGAAVAAVAAVAFACAPARAAGLTGGATAAILTGDDVELDADLDNARQGFSAGLYFAAKAPNFEFRPEILFVEMGTGEGALVPAIGAGPLEFKFDYVQVPFLFKMTSATDKRSGVGLFFGPYFAFNLEAQVTEDVGGVPVTTDIKDLV
ncbi:MAG: outer membrane beta-barrel protein, partial [Planctomycetota bacterium]